ncbi:MAG: hemolysin family protein [Deltaproteobacteria bacterium]|jgi:putative hemolysin
MLLVLSILVVLVTSFFCSLSEASLLSVSRARIHSLAEKNAAARLVERMKQTVDRPIAAILILNTIANTGGAALAGREYDRLFEGAHMGAFTLLLTCAVLIFSELLPKTLGVRNALKASLVLARPLAVLVVLMRPFVWMFEQFVRLFGEKAPRQTFSLDDLRAVARLAVSSQSIGRGEQMIIEAAARLPRIRVGQIMIHREDLVYLSLSADDEDNLVRARRSMHSRLLLCHNDLEDVVGYVNVKALLWRLVQEPEDREEEGLKRLLGESVREPLRVDPSLEVSVLLQQFSTQHEHLALVEADGRVVGMVTLEDVIEELIGEIDDEYDKSPRLMERLSPGLWRFGGGTLWTDVAAALKLPAEEYLPQDIDLDGRYDVNDLAGDRLRGKLRTGGIFTIEKWRFKVTRMRRGKVLHVEVRLLGQPIGTPN